MIAKVSIRDEALLLADLDELVSAGIIHVNYSVGDFEYTFHHALIRDT
jgi:hypothetical protein